MCANLFLNPLYYLMCLLNKSRCIGIEYKHNQFVIAEKSYLLKIIEQSYLFISKIRIIHIIDQAINLSTYLDCRNECEIPGICAKKTLTLTLV